MSESLPHLLPAPRRMRRLAGIFDLSRCASVRARPGASDDESQAAARVAQTLDRRGGESQAPIVHRKKSAPSEVSVMLATLPSPQHYRIEIRPDGARLAGGGAPGLFYATQTFQQLVTQARDARLPALRIDDGPDYPVRGFYHDVSRGKVPTLDTLCGLVEKLAHYKVNQLQLYVEHTFAFKNHPDIWGGSDPLTADDLRVLDEHAAQHHIDLVPSLSTFGHFYTALVSPRKHQLNELPVDASQLPFSVWDRMGHYTLDCRNPVSLALVREMILELRPLFRSKLFNLCCDETFDLGKGRNAARAAQLDHGRLYVDFLKQLVALVREAGCTPMFWGDIIGNHPELVRELPRDVIALDWDYSSNLKDTKSRLFKKARVPFYVCSGVLGWDRWLNDLDTATANILAFAQRGRRDGAIGLLNTDWGDRGHINCLGNSFHGLALGAAASWNTRGTAADVLAFDATFARLEFGDTSGRTVALMRAAARLNVVSWRLFTLWLDPTPHRPAAWWDERTDVPVELLKLDPRRAFTAATQLNTLRLKLARMFKVDAANPNPSGAPRPGSGGHHTDLAVRELLLGCRGSALMNALGGWIICLALEKKTPRSAPAPLDLSNDIRRFEAGFSAIWHARNRPSEYWRVRTSLLELARRLDLAALRGIWVKTPRQPPPPAAHSGAARDLP